MALSRKTFPICIGLIIALSGCFDSGPDCASDASKDTVIKIAQQNPPYFMLATAAGAKDTNSCVQMYNIDFCKAAIQGVLRDRKINISDASYTLDAIRLTAKDSTTGSVSCAADLHVGLPNDRGGAKEPITYKVEKTSDGQLYVTIFDLQ